MISSVEGIIVSETPYGNTSKIINVFTKEHGIIGILANGVKTLKSPLRTKTLKFTYGRFHIYYKEEKLSRLKDVDIIDNLTNIKNDIELFSYLSYIVELTTQVVKQNKDDENYVPKAFRKDKEKYWKLFTKTGKIDYYLKYKKEK